MQRLVFAAPNGYDDQKWTNQPFVHYGNQEMQSLAKVVAHIIDKSKPGASMITNKEAKVSGIGNDGLVKPSASEKVDVEDRNCLTKNDISIVQTYLGILYNSIPCDIITKLFLAVTAEQDYTVVPNLDIELGQVMSLEEILE